jgi:YegS/Rv2252/BmrU family lipid kinase
MIVLNPVAGTGEALSIWGDLRETLRDLGMEFDHRFTERRGHATVISAEAAREGYGMVVVVGGDGTVFEAANGIMSARIGMRPALGVIPTGRGTGFCRTMDIPSDWQVAASLLASGKRRSIDVGWMEYVSSDGVRTGYFTNIAGLGFEGEVGERAESFGEGLTKVVGGRGTRLLSKVITFARYREKDVELHIDDEVYRALATTVAVANGRYLGGRMMIAPDALPDDGMFDVVVIGAGFGPPLVDLPPEAAPPEHSTVERSVAKARIARNMPRLYRGKHVEDSSVMITRGRRVKVISDDRMVLQADGEAIGVAPFTAEVIPKAIDVIA